VTESSSVVEAVARGYSSRASWPGATEPRLDLSICPRRGLEGGPGNGPGEGRGGTSSPIKTSRASYD
jgi:hypothetical protein